jgi:DNA-binding NarL/FixJ family response regulator
MSNNGHGAIEEATPFTVVLVDDVADLRFLIRVALERSARFRVVGEASDGAEAIVVTREMHPDIVLLDVSMPGVDGLDALPSIRETAPATTVGIHSGFERANLWPQAEASGAIAYLEKGTSPLALVDELLAVASVLDVVDHVLQQARAKLAGELESPGAARRFVDETLRRWECEDQLDLVTLLVSELVTNAVVHAGSDVEVGVQLTGDGVRIDVMDQSPTMPVPRTAQDYDTSGRGLELVDALATRWGVDTLPFGKSVWFEVPRLDQ